jgi:hypothetical protein
MTGAHTHALARGRAHTHTHTGERETSGNPQSKCQNGSNPTLYFVDASVGCVWMEGTQCRKMSTPAVCVCE